MALKQSYSSRFGTTHTQAYHKITNVVCNTGSTGTLDCIVGVYATETAKTKNSASLGEQNYTFPYSASINESFISQSYEYLKGLDEYSGSTDV